MMIPADYEVAQENYERKLELAQEGAQERAVEDYLVDVYYAEYIDLSEMEFLSDKSFY